MKLLAVDSSGIVATVAVYEDGIIKASSQVNNKLTHSQTLLPMIERIMNEAGVNPSELDAVAVGEGPGSFTGLRIGAATVKGLCLAIDKPIIPISSLKLTALGFYNCRTKICPIMDARRNQVYTAVYDSDMTVVVKPCAMGIDELLDTLVSCEVTFAGDGVAVHREHIAEKMGERAFFAPAHLRYQNAAAMCELAESMYERGEYISAVDFSPVYLRMSQAERERLEREK